MLASKIEVADALRTSYNWQECFAGSPVNIEYNVVKDKLLEIEGVTAVHDLRIWSLTLNQTVMSAHLAIGKVICAFSITVQKKLFLESILMQFLNSGLYS